MTVKIEVSEKDLSVLKWSLRQTKTQLEQELAYAKTKSMEPVVKMSEHGIESIDRIFAEIERVTE